MAIDMRRHVLALAEAALRDQTPPETQSKPHLSTGRALLLGAGLMTAGRFLAGSRGRQLIQRLVVEARENSAREDGEDYEEDEAERGEDFEDEDDDEEPEAELDEDFEDEDDEEEPEAELDEDFEDEDDDEEPEAELDEDFEDEDDEEEPEAELDEDFENDDDDYDEQPEAEGDEPDEPQRQSRGRSASRGRS